MPVKRKVRKKVNVPKKFYCAVPGPLATGEDVSVVDSLQKAVGDAKFHMDERYEMTATIYELVPIKKFSLQLEEVELSK